MRPIGVIAPRLRRIGRARVRTASRVSASRSASLRLDEGGARHVQAHRLHQHLVAVGGAVEGAGARRRGRPAASASSSSSRPTWPCAACSRTLALSVFDRPLGIGPAGTKTRRQVAEVQRADQQARHDLVADAEHQRGVEHVVVSATAVRHRDRVAREQAQLHAGRALRDAVAHRRHAAGDLRRGAEPARLVLDDVGKALVRLVRRQHVVVGGDDADVGRALGDDAELVVGREAGEGVRHVGAAEPVAAARPVAQASRRSR